MAIGVFKRDVPILSARTDRQFNRARLNLVGWVVRVKRGIFGGNGRLPALVVVLMRLAAARVAVRDQPGERAQPLQANDGRAQ